MQFLKRAMCILLIMIFILNYMAITAMAIYENATKIVLSEQAQEEQESDEVTKLESNKYIIAEEEKQIRRVLPETEIGILKGKFNMPSSAVKIYKDITCKEEVTSGLVATGMALMYEGSEDIYTILVIGDLDNDGKMGQIELTRLIKHVVGLQDAQLQGIDEIVGDITGDGKINQVDITILIRRIVYKELDIPENDRPEAPKIEIIEGEKEESSEYFRTGVKAQITEEINTGIKIDKTTYSINGEKEVEIENGGIVTLEEEGEYEIKAYTYAINGSKSNPSEKTVKIELSLKRLDAKTVTRTNKITVQTTAESLSGIKEYIYYIGKENKDTGEIIYDEGIRTEEDTYTFGGLKENTEYKLKVVAISNAGNQKELLLEDKTRTMPQIEQGNIIVEKSTEEWTNQDVILTMKTEEEVNPYYDLKIEYSIDGGRNWKVYNDAEKAVIEENTEVEIRLTDGTNNSNSITVTVDNIDKIKPVGNLKTSSKTNQITAVVEAEDNQSGIESYTYYIGLKNEQTGEIEYNKVTDAIQETTNIYENLKSNTLYYVKVEVKDIAGNILEIVKEETTKNLPEIQDGQIKLIYSNTEWTNEDVVVSIEKSEGLDLGECKLEYSLDDGSHWAEYDEINKIVVDENCNIIVRITDGINTKEAATGKVSNIDKIKPEGTILESHNTRSINAEVNATDNLSGIKSYIYYIGTPDEETGEIEYILKAGPTDNKNYKFDELLQDTLYYIKVEIEDNAGNKNTIETQVKTDKVLDLNDNNIIVEVSEKEWTKNDVIVTAILEENVDPNGCYLEYTKDGQVWQRYDEENKIIVENNTIVEIRLTDGINIGKSVQVEITNIDKTDPEISKIKTEKTSRNISVEVSAQDTQSGIKSYIYYLGTKSDGTEEIEYTKLIETEENSYTYVNLAHNTTYYIKVEVADSVGNISSKETEEKTLKIPDGDEYIRIEEFPLEWTNESVEVTIEYDETSYEVQYSVDGERWYKIDNLERLLDLIIKENKIIYARLTDGLNVGKEVTLEIGNIDKEKSVIDEIRVKEIFSDGATVELEVTDELSGISNITWYYKEENETSYKSEKETYMNQGGMDAGPQQVTKEKEFRKLAKGTYEIYAEIEDVAGNKIKTEVQRVVLKDVEDLNTANATLRYLPTTWTNGSVNVQVETEIEGYQIEFSKDAKNWLQVEKIEMTENGSVYARLTDGINAGEYITGTVGNIDKTNPIVENIQIAKRETKALTLSVDVQDELSGLGKIDWYYKLNEEADYTKVTQEYQKINGEEAGSTNRETKTLELTGLKGGTYSIYADVYDVAGNKETTHIIIAETVEIPSGISAITIKPNNTNWTNKNVTVTISSTDADYTIQYKKDDGNWTNGTSVSMTANGTVYGRLTDGTNVGEATSLGIGNIDKTLPTVSNISSSNVMSDSFTASIDVQDELSGLGKIDWYYKLSTAASYTKITQEYQTLNGEEAGDKNTTKSLTLDNLTGGSYLVYAEIYDVAGNKTKSETATITTKKIDGLQEGNVTFSQTPTNWTKDNVIVSIRTTVKGYKLEYSLDSKAWYEYNGNIIVEENGPIYARLTDGINVGEAASTTISNIDKKAPTIGNVTGSTVVGNSGTITVKNIVETQSGLNSISFSKEYGVYNWESLASTTFTKNIPGSDSNGTWYIYVKDNAGNISVAKTVTISGVVENVSNVNLRTTDIELDIGETKQLEITYSGTPKTIEYVSSDKSIATVNSTGIVEAQAVGVTNVTVILTDYDGTVTERTAKVEVRKYTVTYDYLTNGGTSSNKTSQELGLGATVDLTPVAVKANYEFVGWNTNKNATTGLTSYKMPKGGVTLYAIFRKGVKATCYYVDSSTNAAKSSQIQGYLYNNNTTASIKLPTIQSISKNSLTWAGRGWSTSTSSSAGSLISSGGNVTISANTTYYASYSTTVTATYNYYSGSAATSTKQTATAYMDYKGTLVGGKPNTPTAPAISGYTQRGWSTSSAYNASTTTPGAITSNTSYYMSYSKQVSVKYNMNGGGGSIDDSIGTSYMSYNGTKVGANITISSSSSITKLHYDRTGWNSNSSGTGTNYTDGTQYSFTDNITLYAKWQLKGYYVVNNSRYYNTLSSAVAGASSGNRIELLATITDSGSVTINKNITLDLSDYTVTKSSGITISSGITVNIEGNANGTLRNSSYQSNYITNNGTLNIKSGTINYTANPSSSDRAVIYNNGVVNISGGEIITVNEGHGIYVNSGKVIINNGSITGQQNGIFIRGSSSVEVNGGTISGSRNGINGNVATIEINGGTVEGNTCGIYSTSSTININGGIVQGNSYGIRYDANTELVVGDSSKSVNNNLSKVIGSTYGVYGTETRKKFDFNNGVIIGETNTTYNSVATCRRGNYAPSTSYNSSDSNYVTSLVNISSSYNYAINNKGYTTLQQAATDAESGDVIVVLKNVTDSSSSNITMSKNVILNLNNYTTTISRPINVNSGVTFRIRGEGSLKGNSNHTIVNSGTLYVESEENSALSNTYSNYAVIDNKGTANVNILGGGTINGNTYGIYNEGSGKLTTDEVSITANTYGIYNTSSSTINVQGGKITANYGMYNNNSSAEFNLTGKLFMTTTDYAIYNNASDIYLNIDLIGYVGPYNIISEDTGIYLGNGTLDFERGYIGYNTIGIEVETGEINITGGEITYNVDLEDDIELETIGIKNEDATINISDGSVYGAYGIYNNGSGIINVSEDGYICCNWYATGSWGIRAAIYNVSNGTINMTDGTVYGYGYGIYNNTSTGKVTITGGYVRGARCYAIYNVGTLSLGNKSISYNPSSLEIESHETYGVYSTKNYNFYNGTIRGTGNPPYSTNTIQIRDGYKAGTVIEVDATFSWEARDGSAKSPEKVNEMTLVPD